MYEIVESFRKIWRIFWKPLEDMIEGFDPIVDNVEILDRIYNQRYAQRYISPCLLSIYFFVEIFYYLFTVPYDPEHPVMMHHVAASHYPVFFRVENDINFGCTYPMLLFIFSFLIFDSMPHRKYLTYHRQNDVLCFFDGRQMNRFLSKKLFHFRSKTRNKLSMWSKVMEFQCWMTFPIPLAINNILKFRSTLEINFRYWFCVPLSFGMFHYALAVIQMGMYFLVTNIHIQIKQRFYLKSMVWTTYRNYNDMLRIILEHVDEIGKYNAFYSKYITVLVLCYGFIGCSLLNGVTSSRAPKGTIVLLIAWGSFGSFYISCIYLFCFIGSKTIHLNTLMFFKLRSMQIALCNSRTVRFSRQLIHLDLMNEYKLLLLKFSSFRLSTVSTLPLNNKLFFFQLVGLVSGIYMQVVVRR